MPLKDTSVTYSANSNGSPTVVYSDWVVTGYLNSDYIIVVGGNDGDNFIEIFWINPGTYQIKVKATNECSTLVLGVSEDIIVTACVPNWTVVSGSNACGQTIATIPVYSQANLNICKRYNREIDGCNNFRWMETGTDMACPGCCTMQFNLSGPNNAYFGVGSGNALIFTANMTVAGSGSYSYNWNAIESFGNNILAIYIDFAFSAPNNVRIRINTDTRGTSTLTVSCVITDISTNCSTTLYYDTTLHISS